MRRWKSFSSSSKANCGPQATKRASCHSQSEEYDRKVALIVDRRNGRVPEHGGGCTPRDSSRIGEKIDGLEETKLRLERALQTVHWQQQQEQSGQQDEMGRLRSELEAEKKKSTWFWTLACKRGEENQRLAAEKEAEVASLI